MINDLTVKISALVTYQDNTTRQILSSLDENGNISHNDTAAHQSVDAARIDGQTDAMTDFAFIDPDTGLSFDIGSILVDDNAKIVTSVVLDISGRFANEDNTWNDFLYQFNSIEGTTPLFKQGTQYVVDAVENTTATQRAIFEQAFIVAGIILTVV